MMLLGIAGFIQVTWLPGFLLLKLTNIKTSKIGNLVFGFSLSLTFNYLLVLLLTTLQIFVQWLLILIFCLELVLLIWLFRKSMMGKFRPWLQSFWAELIGILTTYFSNLREHLIKNERDYFYRKILFGLLFLVALIPLWWVIRIFINNLGTVFNTWDAIVSWNHWATQWAANSLPLNTGRYPQLIPTNWALIYVLTGNVSVQFFVKAIMPLFLFSIILLAVVLGFNKKNAGFFLGGLICYFVIKHFLGEFIPDGYADIPVAFMSLSAIATILWAQALEEKDSLKILLLGAVLAAGTAVTKHTGLYILAAFPVLAYLLVLRKFQKKDFRKLIRLLSVYLVVILLIAGTWYIYKEIGFMRGVEKSEATLITGIMTKSVGNFSFLGRLTVGFSQIGKYIVLYILLILSLFFLEKTYFWIILILPLPFTILWALFLSYDIRNLAIAMPFLSILSGLGIIEILDWIYRKILRPVASWLPIAGVIAVVFCIALVANFLITPTTIINRQITLQRQIFSKSLDEKLYSSLKGQDLTKIKILTNYPVQYLPELEQSEVSFYYNDLEVFTSEMKDSTIGYLLVPVYVNSDIENTIQNLLQSGELKFLWEDHGWISYSFYEIIR